MVRQKREKAKRETHRQLVMRLVADAATSDRAALGEVVGAAMDEEGL